jgi:mediator of RNA polymerase II transcription subunit 10
MYTRSAISRATGENQYALGRALGLEVSSTPPHFTRNRTDEQSFRRQLEESIGTEFPTIPLPPRRHQPDLPNNPDETEINGSGENDASGVTNGDVKHENKEEASYIADDGNAQSAANGTHP